MKRRYGVIVFVVLIVILLLFPARQFIPLPKYDAEHIGRYRLALELSDSLQVRRFKRELSHSAADLAAATSDAVAAGIPLVDNSAAPPVSQNAAPMYLDWTAKRYARHLKFFVYSDPINLSTSYTPAEIQIVQAQYDDNPDLDSAMMKAVDTPTLYTTSENSGPFPEFKIYAPAREAAREIETKANLLALRGQWVQAATVALNIFHIARQLKHQHSLIGYLVDSAVENISLAECTAILSHSEPNAKICALLRQPILDSANNISLKQGIKWGVAELISEMNSLRNNPVIGSSTIKLSRGDKTLYDKMVDVWEARALKNNVAAFNAADEPRAKRRADFQAIDDAIATSTELHDDPLSAPYVPPSDVFSDLAKHDDEVAARIQVALAAIDVLSFKADTGSFPPALPIPHIDPFSDKPLLYRQQKNGFIIYSVGPSETFDGTIAHKTASDIYFIYPALPKKPVPPEALRSY